MKGNKTVTRKKGFSFLALFLGILLGIILTIGAIAGAGYFALTYNLDEVLKLAGVDNSKDEEGRNKIVNTDTDAGGVQNLLDLIGKIYAMAADYGNITLKQVDDLIPASRGLVDQVYSALSEYVELDMDEVRETTFSELGKYMVDKIYDIRPAGLIEKFAGTENNKILEILLCGVEASYVEAPGGKKPLSYDVFTQSGAYRRTGDEAPLPEALEKYVLTDPVDEQQFRVYFFEDGGSYYAAQKSGSGYIATSDAYTIYNAEYAQSSGNYYKDGNDEKIYTNPITLGSFIKNEDGAFNNMFLTDIISAVGAEGDTTLIDALLDGVTLGSLMSGKLDLNSKIAALEIGVLVDIDPFKDDMLAFLAYGLTGISSEPDGDGLYSATYKIGDDGDIPVRVEITDNRIQAIYDMEGNELKGVTVDGITDVINSVDLSVFVDVKPGNKIITYLAYGITDLAEEGGQWTAKSGDDPCTVTLDSEGNIASVYNTVTEKNIPAVGLDGINDRIDGITGTLKIKDLVNIDESNKLMAKIGDRTINDVGEVINDIVVSDVLDVAADNSLVAYLAYGITEIDADAGTAMLDGAQVFLTVEEKADGGETKKLITGVYYDALHESPVPGTGMNDISGKVDDMTKKVKIKDLVPNFDTTNKLMKKIGEKTLDDVDTIMNDLVISDVMDISADNKIMAYLGYGITNVDKEQKTAKYKDGEGKEHDCTIELDGEGNIIKVTYEDGGEKEVTGTLVSEVGKRVDGITRDLKIKDIIEISPDDKLMQKLGEYTVNSVSKAINTLEIADIIDIEADSALMAYLAYGITDVEETTADTGEAMLEKTKVYLKFKTDAEGKKLIEGVYSDDARTTPVEGTTVNGISKRINGITTTLKIKDIMDIEPDDKLMSKLGEYTVSEVSKAIDALELTDVIEVDASSNLMAYLAFGITGINKDAKTATLKDRGTVYLNIVAGKNGDPEQVIEGIYSDDSYTDRIEGTTINKINGRISGLMEDLPLGEIIPIADDNIILSAIKNSTINGLSDRIGELTINELYYAEVYKQLKIVDNNGDGQADEGTEPTVTEAKLYTVVESSAGEGQIVFSKAYIYYTMEDGVLKLTPDPHPENDKDERGKLEAYPGDGKTYYTYGAPQSVWRLLLTENSGGEAANEFVLGMNNIGASITKVSDTLKNSTLRDLDDAGIFDFKNDDLDIVVDKESSTKLGDLPLTDALSKLVELASLASSVPGFGG